MSGFPLPSSLLPELKLPAHQASDFVAAREQLLYATMGARDQYRSRMGSKMNPAVWKPVRRRRPFADLLSSSSTNENDKFTIYRPRSGSHIPRPTPDPSCSPLLVGVGTVEGTLEQIALGLTNSTTDAHRHACTLMNRDVVDARILCTLEAPTPETPFDFTGFKWVANAPVVLASALKTLVRARDYVYLESTGLRVDPTTGERTFHLLVHSVDINCYRSFEHDMGIVRGAVSLGFLFSEREDGSVEVFCKGFVDPQGSAFEQFAVSSAIEVMTGICERAATAGSAKKVGWLMHQRVLREQNGEIADVAEPFVGRCVGCSGNGKDGEPLNQCDACGRSVCSPCRQQVAVMFPTSASSLAARRHETGSIDVCHHCVVFSRRVDAVRVAVEDAEDCMRTSRQFSSSLNRATFSSTAGERVKLAPIKKRSRSLTSPQGVMV